MRFQIPIAKWFNSNWMAHIMTSLIGTIIEGSEKRGWGGSWKGGRWRCICVTDKRQVLFLSGDKWRTRWGDKLRSESFTHCFLFKQLLYHSLKVCSNGRVKKQQYVYFYLGEEESEKNAKYLFSNYYELEGDLKDWLNFGWAWKCCKFEMLKTMWSWVLAFSWNSPSLIATLSCYLNLPYAEGAKKMYAHFNKGNKLY